LGTPRGRVTRRDEKEGGVDRVLDIGVYYGGVEVERRVWDWIIGLDHRPIEMEVEVRGWVVEKEENKMGIVDWEKFEAELKCEEEGEWMDGVGGGYRKSRRDLEEGVERFEGKLSEGVERCRGRRRWKEGKKKWWSVKLEEKYKRGVEVEKEWERGRRVGDREMVKGMRKDFKKKLERVRREHWVKYLEGLGEKEGYQWVKTDRDFMVDLPSIRGEDGNMVEKDEEKGRAIVRGLGKRNELDQEEEGFWEEVSIEEEEVEECLKKQNDKKAAGENELGGKVLKVA